LPKLVIELPEKINGAILPQCAPGTPHDQDRECFVPRAAAAGRVSAGLVCGQHGRDRRASVLEGVLSPIGSLYFVCRVLTSAVQERFWDDNPGREPPFRHPWFYQGKQLKELEKAHQKEMAEAIKHRNVAS